MKLSEYKYDFSEDLIAKQPTDVRDDARLMVYDRRTHKIEHRAKFKEIERYFKEDDVMIMNNTKVFPARLHGSKEKTGAIIDIILLRELNAEQKFWDVLVDPARKIRIGNKLYFGEDNSMVAEVIDNTTSRGRTLRFLYDGTHEEFKKALYALGETPIPKIIRPKAEPSDAENYQTIYAEVEGAVVAPAAGFHFSKVLLKKLELKGVKEVFITLHAGLGNFHQIDVEDLSKHKMDSEQMFISQEAADTVNKAKLAGKRVCCIGTTTMRAIESSVSTQKLLNPYDGWTNKFIHEPYEFSIATCMVTNFHLPYSNQFIMVSAFCGYNELVHLYEVAKKEGYRFGTYGDAMLIL